MIGFCTRLSAIIVYIGLLSLHNQCPLVLNGSDDLMRVLSFMFIFSPAGAVCSVDSWLRAEKRVELHPTPTGAPVQTAPWVQRMMQVQISLVYLSSFLCKINGSQWRTGIAAYYAAHLVEFQKFPIPWLADHAPGYQMLTYYTLGVELALGTLVWYRPARYWVLLAGLLMHIGIDWTMNLPCFELLFVSSYINFIEPADLERLIKLGKDYIARLKVRIQLPTIHLPLPAGIMKIALPANIQFATLFIVVSVMLTLGVIAAQPIRVHYLAMARERDYNRHMIGTKARSLFNLHRCDQLPDSDKQKLAAEEDCALVLSLTNDYRNAAALLRHLCKYRLEQNRLYNPALVKALSYLGDIYLETGHLDASALCYQTLSNYDLVHMPEAQAAAAVDLNNLAVISYFRHLINQDKPTYYLELKKANNLYIQALNELHLNNEPDKKHAVQPRPKWLAAAEIDILHNRYLALRDSCDLREARQVKAQAAKLRSKFR